MATTAKKTNQLVLGPTQSENDKRIAIQEIAARLNLLIIAVNQIIEDLNA